MKLLPEVLLSPWHPVRIEGRRQPGRIVKSRARDLTEAILWHGGEGAASRDAFRDLQSDERSALLAFLSSL